MSLYGYNEIEEKSPLDILNHFKDGKSDNSTCIENLVSLGSSRDESLRIEISDIMLEIYRTAEPEGSAESEQLRTIIEEKVGEIFISKYNIFPSEAKALGLIELIMRAELENNDEIPNIHHVHAAFRINDIM